MNYTFKFNNIYNTKKLINVKIKKNNEVNNKNSKNTNFDKSSYLIIGQSYLQPFIEYLKFSKDKSKFINPGCSIYTPLKSLSYKQNYIDDLGQQKIANCNIIDLIYGDQEFIGKAIFNIPNDTINKFINNFPINKYIESINGKLDFKTYYLDKFVIPLTLFLQNNINAIGTNYDYPLLQDQAPQLLDVCNTINSSACQLAISFKDNAITNTSNYIFMTNQADDLNYFNNNLYEQLFPTIDKINLKNDSLKDIYSSELCKKRFEFDTINFLNENISLKENLQNLKINGKNVYDINSIIIIPKNMLPDIGIFTNGIKIPISQCYKYNILFLYISILYGKYDAYILNLGNRLKLYKNIKKFIIRFGYEVTSKTGNPSSIVEDNIEKNCNRLLYCAINRFVMLFNQINFTKYSFVMHIHMPGENLITMNPLINSIFFGNKDGDISSETNLLNIKKNDNYQAVEYFGVSMWGTDLLDNWHYLNKYYIDDTGNIDYNASINEIFNLINLRKSGNDDKVNKHLMNERGSSNGNYIILQFEWLNNIISKLQTNNYNLNGMICESSSLNLVNYLDSNKKFLKNSYDSNQLKNTIFNDSLTLEQSKYITPHFPIKIYNNDNSIKNPNINFFGKETESIETIINHGLLAQYKLINKCYINFNNNYSIENVRFNDEEILNNLNYPNATVLSEDYLKYFELVIIYFSILIKKYNLKVISWISNDWTRYGINNILSSLGNYNLSNYFSTPNKQSIICTNSITFKDNNYSFSNYYPFQNNFYYSGRFGIGNGYLGNSPTNFISNNKDNNDNYLYNFNTGNLNNIFINDDGTNELNNYPLICNNIGNKDGFINKIQSSFLDSYQFARFWGWADGLVTVRNNDHTNIYYYDNNDNNYEYKTIFSSDTVDENVNFTFHPTEDEFYRTFNSNEETKKVVNSEKYKNFLKSNNINVSKKFISCLLYQLKNNDKR